MSANGVASHLGRAAWLREGRLVAQLAGPLTLTNLMQMAMGTTDVVMMGWLGPDTIAAGALGLNVYLITLIFGIGLLNAVAPMLAQAIGRDAADRDSDVRRTVQQGLWLAACVAVPSWCALWGTEPLLIALGQDAALAKSAGLYVRALQWAMLPFLGYLVLRAFISALERPGWTLVVGIAALGLNGLGNWCLMLGKCGLPPLGIAGSGLATLGASVFMFAALLLVVCCDRQFRRYRLVHRWWRPDLARLRALWRLGLPMAATLAFEVTIFNAAVFLMGWIGAAELAAHAIAIQIVALSFMVPLGIGQAATVRVGLAHGASDRDGVRRAGWSAFALGLAVSVVTSLILMAVPGALIGVFLDTSDPKNLQVVQHALSFIAVAALFQIADGAQAIGAGMLRGLRDARVPMLFALLGYWGVGLPFGVALAFPLKLGGIGIWIGLATGLAIVAGLTLRRWAGRQELGLV